MMLKAEAIEGQDFMQETHDVTITGSDEKDSHLTFEVELPWPDAALSPNARGHWSKQARAKKVYRAKCRTIGLAAGLGFVEALPAAPVAVAVHLEFYPPDRRARDWDNMLASMKSGLDGLSDAMGVDDSRWRLGFEVMDVPATGGRVVVLVEVKV